MQLGARSRGALEELGNGDEGGSERKERNRNADERRNGDDVAPRERHRVGARWFGAACGDETGAMVGPCRHEVVGIDEDTALVAEPDDGEFWTFRPRRTCSKGGWRGWARSWAAIFRTMP